MGYRLKIIGLMLLLTSCLKPKDVVVVSYYASPEKNHYYYGKAIMDGDEDTLHAPIDSVYKTGEWTEIVDGKIETIFTYKNNLKEGKGSYYIDGYLSTVAYYKNNEYSATDTTTEYYPHEVRKNAMRSQSFGVFPFSNKIINYWDRDGNMLVDNGKGIWIDYFKEEKKRFGFDVDDKNFKSINMSLTGAEIRHNQDSSFYEEVSFTVDTYTPFMDLLFYKAPGSNYKLFYFAQEADTAIVVTAEVYSCDSIIINSYGKNGGLVRTTTIDYEKLRWDSDFPSNPTFLTDLIKEECQ